ncbi:flagellar hook-basal body complex protein FliE [Sphingosinicella humi]|uniref:Flagellar hook-basal body complex protein FliE n=1 Tax=Allosphingosinicella humi TaxID=2068657 RepID=A0A2U2J105_9SPHN|nr:flagellar hook-basal body complex protein FliE [Sphingosinicella humi]PWG02015.1 flagellar hook-basal body complex protein FliE [Sphingosinicella humi]
MTSIDSSKLLAMRTAILEQNSALQRAAGAGMPGGIAGTTDAKGVSGFGDALQSALAEVNALQDQASTATTAYETGETTDIAAVMLARQKASIGFEATLQVRNKLLSAYKDIMSMPV